MNTTTSAQLKSHAPNVDGRDRIDRSRLADLTALVPLAGAEREQLPVYAPFTGEQITSVSACTKADVQEAIRRARQAQRLWAEYPVTWRQGVILRFHDLVLKHQEELLDLVQLESGKARRHASEELLDVIITARHYAYRAEEYLRPRRHRGALPLLTTTHEYRHPVGVVGLIAPWNYPLTLAVSDATPALLAGNAVVLKPAAETPLTALRVAQLLYEAGLPQGVFQVVTGRGSEVGSPLIAGVNFVGFTGSTATGRVVARQAGEQLIDASMELGGKNPMLVLDDADLDRAAAGATRACFSNTGQLCISIERLYVQAGIYNRFVEAFAEKTRRLRLGSAYSLDVEVGSLISQEQLDKVQEHVEDAVAKGATVLAGGRHRPDLGPYFYEPTILMGVTPEMRVAREETFGPVVSVYRFETVDEAVRLANDSVYGLNASIWTQDTDKGRRIAQRIACGTVNVNEGYAAAWASLDAPMGGMKASGVGRRHGREGFLKYTESQTVAVQRVLPLGWLPHPGEKPFVQLLTRGIALLRHIPGLR